MRALSLLVVALGLAAIAAAAGNWAFHRYLHFGSGFNSGNSAPPPKLAAQPPRALHLLVIGGTSGIGLETVKAALARGHSVVAFARHPPAVPLQDPKLRYATGDIRDADQVRAAMAGVDVVVTTVSAGNEHAPVTLFSSGAMNVLAAMQQAQVRRLIAVTGIGAGDSLGHGGWYYEHVLYKGGFRAMYEDKTREERLIRASDRDWTLVRPGYLRLAGATPDYRVAWNLAGTRWGSISREDVAQFIVAAAEGDLYPHQAVVLTH